MMPGFPSAPVAAALLLRLAAAGTVNPLGLNASTCSDNTITVPTTLSGFAEASASVVDILPTYVSNPLNCGYYTCFQAAMNAWSVWEFGAAPSTSANGTTSATTATTATASGPQSPASASPSITPPATTTASPLAPRQPIELGEQFPFNSAVSSCCGICGVWAGNAQILWWPGKTSEAPPGSYSTTVYEGTTLTSPTVYFAITGPFAINSCGSSATGPSSAILAVPNSDIQQIFLPTSGPPPIFDRPSAPLTPTNLEGCETATTGQFFLTQTLDGTVVAGDRCFPILAIPTQVVALEPGWSDCVPAIYGVSDPPRALTVATMGPPPPVPAGPTSSANPAPPADAKHTSAAPPTGPAPLPAPTGPPGVTPQSPAPTPAPPPPAAEPAPTPTVLHIGSQAFTLDMVTTTEDSGSGATHTVLGLVTAGSTIVAGGSAMMLSGTAVSLGSSALVVGSHTATYNSVASSTSAHLGDLIMSGIGGPTASDSALSIHEASAPTGPAAGSAMPTILTGQAARDRPLQLYARVLLTGLMCVAML